MANFTNSKGGVGSVYPENAIESSQAQYEPLITVDLLKSRHLFGVPLVSAQKDPITQKAQVMTDAMLSDYIEGAISQAALELKIDIMPNVYREKQPFDIYHYASFGYTQLSHKPASRIIKLSVTPSNDRDIYIVPNEWVETAGLARGQINIVPLTVAFVNGTQIPTQDSGGAAFLQILGNKAWIPFWWQVEYISGFEDGMVPRVLNEYIGTVAAMEVLSMLALTYARSSSHSLGIDGLSQSVSTPGPQIFRVRLEELEKKKATLSKKIRVLFGYKLMSGTL